MANKITDSQTKTTNEDTRSLSPKKLYKSVLKKYPDVLTVPQASAVLGISTKTMYRLLNAGAIESLKIGRSFKIPKIFLLRYLKIIDTGACRVECAASLVGDYDGANYPALASRKQP